MVFLSLPENHPILNGLVQRVPIKHDIPRHRPERQRVRQRGHSRKRIHRHGARQRGSADVSGPEFVQGDHRLTIGGRHRNGGGENGGEEGLVWCFHMFSFLVCFGDAATVMIFKAALCG